MMNFKKFINKLVSSKDEKTKKKISNGFEFDAVPDFPRKIPNTPVPDNNINNNHTKNHGRDFEEKCQPNSNDRNKKCTTDENEPEFFSSEKEEYFRESERNNYTPRGPTNISHTNMTFNGCTNTHLGPTYNFSNEKPPQKAPTRTFKKTEAIKGLLKCKDEVESSHMQFLATHFGSKWRDIGMNLLGLTAGEVDTIAERYEGHQERGFQMLKVWWQKKGEDGSVGELCKKLWNGDMDEAKEAVRQLSLNIEHLM